MDSIPSALSSKMIDRLHHTSHQGRWVKMKSAFLMKLLPARNPGQWHWVKQTFCKFTSYPIWVLNLKSQLKTNNFTFRSHIWTRINKRLVKGNDVCTLFSLWSPQKYGGFTTGPCPEDTVVAAFPLNRHAMKSPFSGNTQNNPLPGCMWLSHTRARNAEP